MLDPQSFESRLREAYDRWIGEMPTNLDTRAFVRTTRASAARAVWRPARQRLSQLLTPMPVRISVAVVALALVAILGLQFLPRMPGVAAPGVTGSPSPAASPSPTDSPSSTPGPSPSASSLPTGPRVVHGWPGSRATNNPAGTYSWRVGERRWMHKVDGQEGIGDSVEITIDSVDDSGVVRGSAVERTSWPNEGPYLDRPARVNDVITQVWLLDVDATRIYILVESYPGTRPALLAEAEVVIDSMRIEPSGTSAAPLLTFTLLAGWDSG